MANNDFIKVQKHLKGVDYPASKQELLKHADDAGLQKDIRSEPERLPDEQYDSPVSVTKALDNLR